MTHQISYLFGCDKVIIMNDGRIEDYDTPDVLKPKLYEIEMSLKKDE